MSTHDRDLVELLGRAGYEIVEDALDPLPLDQARAEEERRARQIFSEKCSVAQRARREQERLLRLSQKSAMAESPSVRLLRSVVRGAVRANKWDVVRRVLP